MKSKSFSQLILPLFGVAGIAYGVFFSSTTTTVAPAPETHLNLPPTSSFDHAISGSGLVEANTRNIAVGSSLPGIVSELFVMEGDSIKKGQPLFRLDDRAARAEIATAESNLVVARAKVAEAQVALADQNDQLTRVKGLKAGIAVTVDRVSRINFAQRSASTRVIVAQAEVEEAEARLKAAKTTLSKLTVTAPITGRVLKMNTRLGEFVDAGTAATAPLVVGNDTPLHVRVSLDENDLWRFSKEAKATGALRSNRNVTFPLSFVRLDPYVMPKTSLTGSTAERVDTRVMEVVYRIEAMEAPVYIGQQVDIFIEEKPSAASGPDTPAPLSTTSAPEATPTPDTPPESKATPVAEPTPAPELTEQ